MSVAVCFFLFFFTVEAFELVVLEKTNYSLVIFNKISAVDKQFVSCFKTMEYKI